MFLDKSVLSMVISNVTFINTAKYKEHEKFVTRTKVSQARSEISSLTSAQEPSFASVFL